MEQQKRKYEFYFQIRDQVARTYNELKKEKKDSDLLDVIMLYFFHCEMLESIVEANKFETDDEVIDFINNKLFNRFELSEDKDTYELFDKIENKVVYSIHKDCLAYTIKLCKLLCADAKDYATIYFSWRYPKDIITLSDIGMVSIEIEPVCIEKFGSDNEARVAFTFQFGVHVMDWWDAKIKEAYVYWHDDDSNITIKIKQSCNVVPNNDLKVITAFKDYILPIVREVVKDGYDN